MKKLTLLTSLLFSLALLGQDDKVSLPLKDKKVFYEAVVPVDSVSKDVLYDRLKLWAMSYFKISEKELLTLDKSIGMIKGKGKIGGFAKAMQTYDLAFTFELAVKDNKFKYTFYDFLVPDRTHFLSTETLEYYYDYYLAGKKINRGAITRFLQECQEKLAAMIAELTTAARKKDTDW